MIDPLEQRQLLSVTNGHTLGVQNLSDVIVNQTPIDWDLQMGDVTSAGRAIATNDNGDAVVVWADEHSIFEVGA